mmetsp:Transcript_26101/g.44391  ORF Transcript_26101/g.44391 Transcript_26101/m.44391 type:complete len:94 (-) Transcript_26101:41-322(-)
MLVVATVGNSIGAAVLKILVEGMETAGRGEEEVVAEEEDHDVAHHEEGTGKSLKTTEKRNDNMMTPMRIWVMLCVGICLCFCHYPETSEGGSH